MNLVHCILALVKASPRKPRELVAELIDEDEREVRIIIRKLIEQGHIRPCIKWNLHEVKPKYISPFTGKLT